MQVERTSSSELLVDKLPDGSKVIVDPKSETVFALNATAGAAWDACSHPTTLSKVAEDMRRSLDGAVTEELALAAILQLQDKNLVTTSESSTNASRRTMLATLGGIALPLVVSLTMAEQRAHAQVATSGIRGSTTPPPTTLPIG
jgi:Coenzyme PQQ synthesis protein D (PqqD)